MEDKKKGFVVAILWKNPYPLFPEDEERFGGCIPRLFSSREEARAVQKSLQRRIRTHGSPLHPTTPIYSVQTGRQEGDFVCVCHFSNRPHRPHNWRRKVAG